MAHLKPSQKKISIKPGQKAEPWNDPNRTPYIQIENVNKVYDNGYTAVDDMSLSIYEGEFFSLLGPSGCGKTTLLRMLAGFESPTSGKILLDGEDLIAIPPHKRPVNMMFQSYALFPHMTVEQNIMFGLKQDKLAKAEIKKRTEEALEIVELGDFRKRRPHQLSGGQQQRVALARNLAKKPKIILLDEPLGALDKKLREQTQFELVNIQEELNMTFIMVTHDQEEAMTMSTRIAVMNQGRMMQLSTPTALYEFPKSRYVAEFIGDVNVFDSYIIEKGNDYTVVEDKDGNQYTANHAVEAVTGEMVSLAVRPEKIHISKTKPLFETKASNYLYGEVWDIAYLGNLSIYYVMLENGEKVTVARTNRHRDEEQEITWEDKVHLTWANRASIILLN
ncbi:MAG: polyamine ABC transporter ATP-binding protein [Gammaproteobacteria bacterium]|nr:polyamine ABC transporter ATP-binding protein [Gammaproteobacteria bacterium]